MRTITSRPLLAVFVILALVLVANYVIVQHPQKVSTQQTEGKINSRKNNLSTAILSPLTQASILKVSNHEQSKIQLLVKSEARGLYELNNDPETSEQRIHKMAQSFDQNQIVELEEIAIDESKTTDERLAAVYFLKHVGAKAQSALLHVFSNPTKIFKIPALAHTRTEANQQFEFALRTMALESIENNVHESEGALHVPALVNTDLPQYLSGLYKMVSLGEKIHDPLLKKQFSLNLAQENQ